MATVVVSSLPRQVSSYPSARGVVGDLPAGPQRLEVKAARYAWPTGAALQVLVEASEDGGDTWRLVASFGADGDAITDPRTGEIATHSAIGIELNSTGGTKLRTSALTLGVDVDTEIETIASDDE
jgi:hypothetical protein